MTFYFSHLQSPLKLVIESDPSKAIPDKLDIQMATTNINGIKNEVWTNNPPGLACSYDRRGTVTVIKKSPQGDFLHTTPLSQACCQQQTPDCRHHHVHLAPRHLLGS